MRVRLRLTGRVQGVGFRWFVRDAARRAGVAGWVRNEPDGSVILEAEGEPAAIEELRAAVGEGPPAARVMGVESLAHGADPLPQPFSLEH